MTLMLRLESNVTMLFKTTNAICDEFHYASSTSTLGIKRAGPILDLFKKGV